jgi:hypothetical protein
MSDMHDAPEGALAIVDNMREWAIYRCGHGCLHLTLDRLMLTFTEAEFHAFQDLMRRAGERLQALMQGPAEIRPH